MNYEEFVKMDEQSSSHWWYEIRRELLKYAFNTRFPGASGLKILDLASACGDNFVVCSKYGSIYGIDISSHAIGYCRHKGISTIIQGDVQHLPFKSDAYDVVIALDVFEHLEDDIASMKEIRRVLKDEGILIFNTPACMSLFSYHDKAFHHVRRYAAGELKNKLNSAGLPVKFITYWSFFIFPAVFAVRKLFKYGEKSGNEAVSDFHISMSPLTEKILRFLGRVELALIKRNIPLFFGVSLFGITQKGNLKT
jgi:ubiquinone/menaquinone biosynthesis C-methylase UbiE